ncbi:MAG: hypothetical protein QG588_782, partial [Candidatus Poribacteria bacterium]|nr:hypothetical protein [Candidatus Poribacteria bacterium]
EDGCIFARNDLNTNFIIQAIRDKVVFEAVRLGLTFTEKKFKAMGNSPQDRDGFFITLTKEDQEKLMAVIGQ